MDLSALPIPPRLPTLIFLNGPAGVGKTTLAEHLVNSSPDGTVTQHHHASPLWSMIDCLVGDGDEGALIDYSDPALKASSVPYAGPVIPSHPPTYREALISLGFWARDIFGPWALSRIAVTATRHYLLNGFTTVVFPACRTQEDIELLVRTAGAQNCLLVRIFRDGHSFANDLGSYMPERPFGVPTVDLHNRGTVEDFCSSFDALFVDHK